MSIIAELFRNEAIGILEDLHEYNLSGHRVVDKLRDEKWSGS